MSGYFRFYLDIEAPLTPRYAFREIILNVDPKSTSLVTAYAEQYLGVRPSESTQSFFRFLPDWVSFSVIGGRISAEVTMLSNPNYISGTLTISPAIDEPWYNDYAGRLWLSGHEGREYIYLTVGETDFPFNINVSKWKPYPQLLSSEEDRQKFVQSVERPKE